MTVYLKLNGKVEWAQNLFIPDEYSGAKRWTCLFFPDPESKKKIQESGLRLEFKTNSRSFPGEEYIRPRRDCMKVIKGKTVEFEPPRILNKDGTPSSERIGNGTKVQMTLSVFDAGRFKGHRLEEVRILDLVTYERPEENTAEPEVKTETKGTEVKLPRLPF
jgi:hypothetical protein